MAAYIVVWLFIMPFVLFVDVPLLGMFISFLAISITNLRDGKKNSWPKKNITGLAIFASLTVICLVAFIIGNILFFNAVLPMAKSTSSSNSQAQTMTVMKNMFIFY